MKKILAILSDNFERFLNYYFPCDKMIKPFPQSGDMPSSKEVYKNTIDMAWPSALEAVMVSLISSVDTIMVGFLGAGAIAAVGITNQPKFIFLALIFSLNVGVTAIVARRRGENDMDGANKCLRQSLLLSVIIAVVITIAGIAFAKPVMIFSGAPDDILDDSIGYFQIIAVGFFFNALSLTINAAQRGVGNTKISLRTNLTANVVNMIFNYLLIGGNLGFPAMGVRGAAVASTLGGMVAFFMSCKSVLNVGGFLQISFKDSWKFDKRTLVGLISISSSAMIEQLCMRVGFFIYAKLVASLGTTALATHQICMNIINLSFCFGDGFGIAASALVGQSLGAKRKELAILYGKVSQKITLIVSFVLMFIFIFGRTLLMSFFTTDTVIISMGAEILILVGFITYGQTAQVVYSGCLRGAGDSKFIAAMSLITTAFFRPLLTWFLCFPMGLGLIGAWISLLVDQYVRCTITYLRFRNGKWANIKL